MNLITITQVRKDIYRLVDQVIENGKPLYFKRKGKLVSISIKEKKKNLKLANLPKRNIVNGDPNEILNFTDFEWKEEKKI